MHDQVEKAADAFHATIDTLKSEKAQLEGALLQLREERDPPAMRRSQNCAVKRKRPGPKSAWKTRCCASASTMSQRKSRGWSPIWKAPTHRSSAFSRLTRHRLTATRMAHRPLAKRACRWRSASATCKAARAKPSLGANLYFCVRSLIARRDPPEKAAFRPLRLDEAESRGASKEN